MSELKEFAEFVEFEKGMKFLNKRIRINLFNVFWSGFFCLFSIVMFIVYFRTCEISFLVIMHSFLAVLQCFFAEHFYRRYIEFRDLKREIELKVKEFIEK